MKKLGNIALRVIAFFVALVLALFLQEGARMLLAPKCDNCGKKIEGTSYKAEGHTYCFRCAHSLYPNAVWK